MKKMFGLMTVAAFVLSIVTATLAGCAGAPASSGGGTVTVVTMPGDAGGESADERSKPARVKALQGVPAFVNEAYLQASEDVLVGVGTYKVGSDTAKIGAAKGYAETRARADLSRQLQVIMKNMVTDYTVGSELDDSAAASFQESITQSLSKATLQGAVTKQMDIVDGVLWLVMEYSKSSASKDFDAAQAAAKLAVPAALAFDALKRMDTAFDKEAGGGPVPVTE